MSNMLTPPVTSQKITNLNQHKTEIVVKKVSFSGTHATRASSKAATRGELYKKKKAKGKSFQLCKLLHIIEVL